MKSFMEYTLKIPFHKIFINPQNKGCQLEKSGRHYLNQVIKVNIINYC